MPRKREKKQFIRVDKQLLLIKQGDITTAANKKQIYRIRIVQWAKYQAVLEKRLFVFSEQLMDYIPGRTMGLNLNDMQAVFQNREKIMKILEDSFEHLDDNKKSYKQKILDLNKKNDENNGDLS